MAESRSSSQKARTKTTSRSSNGSSPKAKPKSKSTSGRAKPAAQSKPTARSGSRSKNGAKAASTRSKATPSRADDSASSVKETASSVKDTAGKVASKAAGPAIAVGAAAAGVAGGVLLRGKLRRNKRVLGVPLPRSLNSGFDAKSIAKTVGDASSRFAKTSKAVSRDIERAGEQAERIGRILGDGERGQAGSRRSPVEVVLDGLTHRRGGGDSDG